MAETTRKTPAFWLLKIVPFAMLLFALMGIYAVATHWNTASQDSATKIWMAFTLLFSIFIGYMGIDMIRYKKMARS